MIALLLLILLCLSSAPEALAADGTTLRLKQHCPTLGNLVIYSNEKAFRIERGPVVSIACAPDWNVSVFNQSKKLIMELAFDRAVHSARITEAATLALTEPAHPWTKARLDNIARLSAERWINNSASKERKGVSTIHNLRCWVLADKGSARCAEFLAATCGVPFLGGIPLRFSYYGQSTAFLPMQLRSASSAEPAKEQNWLDTTEATRVTVSDAMFRKPSGFKKTANYTSLYLGAPVSKDNEIINDLLKNPETLFQSR
jgi:hypothetical protein